MRIQTITPGPRASFVRQGGHSFVSFEHSKITDCFLFRDVNTGHKEQCL